MVGSAFKLSRRLHSWWCPFVDSFEFQLCSFATILPPEAYVLIHTTHILVLDQQCHQHSPHRTIDAHH